MHYLICYDIESDRRREKVAKTLLRWGCHRVQRSVFVAARLEGKHLAGLRRDLGALMRRAPVAGGPGSSDSILLIPLREEYAAEVGVLGANNIREILEENILKILL